MNKIEYVLVYNNVLNNFFVSTRQRWSAIRYGVIMESSYN